MVVIMNIYCTAAASTMNVYWGTHQITNTNDGRLTLLTNASVIHVVVTLLAMASTGPCTIDINIVVTKIVDMARCQLLLLLTGALALVSKILLHQFCRGPVLRKSFSCQVRKSGAVLKKNSN